MRNRILYLVRFYFATVLLFIVMKPCFMLYNGDGHHLSVGSIAEVVAHGLQLDMSTALYYLIIPFLAVVASLWTDKWRLLRVILLVYNGIISVAFAIIFVVDTSLYAFWGFKLDATVFDYLDSTGDAFVSVSLWYIILRVFVILALAAALWCLYRHVTPKASLRLALKPRVISTCTAVVMIPLLVIGVRGGVSTATTNIGQTYFSSDQFLNHSAVNPVFSMMATMGKSDVDKLDYHYYSHRQLAALTKGLYDTRSIGSDTLLNTRRPNVLIIIMEGCGGAFTQIGGHPEIMPHLNQLANEGVDFTRCFGNSFRTDRGTVCVLSGYPSFPTLSIMKIPAKSRTLPSIAGSLVRNGYKTDFLYGGDIDFTNMRSYLMATGYQHITSDDDYSIALQHTGKWGVPDNVTFGTLYDMLSKRPPCKPWHTAFLTLSSHEPWTVPIKRFDYEVYNAFAFLDDCIGNFISKFRKTPQWKNTLIVILPDHGIKHPNLNETDLLRNHIPMIWTGGAVKAHRCINVLANQTDLAATLLGQLGIRHDEFTFSRDVTSKTYTNQFAYHTYNNGFSMVDKDGFTVYDLDSKRALVGKDHQGSLNTGKAILQMTSQNLKNRK